MSDSLKSPVLQYDSNPNWVTLHWFYSEVEAQLLANALDDQSIRCQILNENARGVFALYGSMVKVGLQVMSNQLEQARDILAEHLRPDAKDFLEPAEADDASQPRTVQDADGQSITLLAVRAYESAGAMQEAAMVLETARIEPFLPQLISRGDAPAGAGPRFILRVQADDVYRARAALSPAPSSAGENNADGELQCPNCGAWSIYEINHELINIVLCLIGKSKPAQCECLKCHNLADRSEFTLKREP